MSTPSPHDKTLKLKIASELVLGNQAAVAFSRAFYLENLLLERSLSECDELSSACQVLLDHIKRFLEEISNDSSSNLSPLEESTVRRQCTEILESLENEKGHQLMLNNFMQKLIQAKRHRQAKSCLLQTLSAQNTNISSQFDSMSLNELLNDIHVPEFSCFINNSDFKDLEVLVEEWESYRKCVKDELAAFEKKITEFVENWKRHKMIREHKCAMILSQITKQGEGEAHGTDTLKRNTFLRKVSNIIRKPSNRQSKSRSVSTERSPSQLSIASTSFHDSHCQQTF